MLPSPQCATRAGANGARPADSDSSDCGVDYGSGVATIAVVNQKGGVDKTTVTLGLASAAWICCDRCLAINLDPRGNATLSAYTFVGAAEAATEFAAVYDVATGR